MGVQNGVRRVIAGVGRTFIASGVTLLLFVVYQLWGTGIAEARDQRHLKAVAEVELAAAGVSLDELDRVAAGQAQPTVVSWNPTPTDAPTPTTASTIPSSPSSSSATPTAPPSVAPTVRPTSSVPAAPTTTIFRSRRPAAVLKPGDAIGVIKIPKINVRKAIISGTSVNDLKKAPGHYTGTPLPGQPGNAAIAGHRTTYGAPFHRLDELKPGDPIFVATAQGIFRYDVRETKIVSPKAFEVLNNTPGRNLLTLTTCHPKLSAAKRMIVVGELIGEAAPADVAPEPPPTTPPTVATTPPTVAATVPPSSVTPSSVIASSVPVPTSAAPASSAPPTPPPTVPPTSPPVVDGPVDPTVETTLSLEGAGGSRKYRIGVFAGSAAAWANSLAWAAVCGVVWLVSWLVIRRLRILLLRWGLYAMGFVVLFLPALYFCFENVSRLLPENV